MTHSGGCGVNSADARSWPRASFHALSELCSFSLNAARGTLRDRTGGEVLTQEDYAQLALEAGYLPALAAFSEETFRKMVAPTSDRAPTRFELGRAFAPARVENRCSAIAAFLSSRPLWGTVGSMEPAGDSCIISDEQTMAFGLRLILGLDRVYNSACDGAKGTYTCAFQYNLRCRTEGEDAEGLFEAGFCLPYRRARQPVIADSERLEDGGWRATGFKQAE